MPGIAYSEDGITDTEIIVGQSCALEGPAASLGINMRAGLNAAFGEINASGGIRGRRIKLISRNDGYEPIQAIRATKELVENDKVFALVGAVGTPTSMAVLPIVDKNKIPFFGAFTGAEALRHPVNRYVINVRASYNEETEALAEFLIGQKKKTKIACFYQNDSYGRAGLNGIRLALSNRQMELVETASYERNTTAVKSALIKIRRAAPDAIVMIGAYKPCSEFIKTAKQLGMDGVTFCNISFVGAKALANELKDAGDGVIISQVVQSPEDATSPVVQAYRAAMAAHQPGAEPDFISLEGYIVGRLFCEVIKRMTGPVTREGFIDAIHSAGTYAVDSIQLSFSTTDHQGSDWVFLTVIENQKIVAVVKENDE
ncbi:MAG: ABC transporter substrate-binding protein [Planctomycetota bacterium]